MNMTITHFSLTLFVFLIIACQAWAETVSYHGQFSASVRHFEYQEYGDSDNSLNKENGFLPGLRIVGTASMNDFNLSASAEVFDGTVAYDGHLQTGQPYTTDTDTRLLNYSVGAAWQPQASLTRLFFYLQRDAWERDIQPKGLISGLFEEYSWYTIKLGMAHRFKIAETLELELRLGPTRTKDARITVHLSDFGYGNPELEMPSRNGYFLGASLIQKKTTHGSIHVDLEHTHFEFGKSNTKTLVHGSQIVQIHEPRSESDHTTLRFGYRFGL